jgi:hypothetical protein
MYAQPIEPQQATLPLRIIAHPSAQQRAAYLDLRMRCYQHDLGLDRQAGALDRWDEDAHSHTLLALRGEEVIGGVRLSGVPNGAVNNKAGHTPAEQLGLDLHDALPQLALHRHAYCQSSRLAVAPAHRDAATLQAFCEAVISHSAQLGYRYVYSIAGMARSRLYRKVFRNLGLDYTIYTSVSVPPEPGFADLPHFLSVGCLHRHKQRM